MIRKYENTLKGKTIEQLIKIRKKIISKIDESHGKEDFYLPHYNILTSQVENSLKLNFVNLLLHEKINKLIIDVLNNGDENNEIRIRLEKRVRLRITVDKEYVVRNGHVRMIHNSNTGATGNVKTKISEGPENFYFLYQKLYLVTWDKEFPLKYSSKRMLDGIQWSLMVRVNGNEVFKYSASNEIPMLFHRLEDLFGERFNIQII